MNLGTIMLILSSLATVIQLVEVELGAGTGAELKRLLRIKWTGAIGHWRR